MLLVLFLDLIFGVTVRCISILLHRTVNISAKTQFEPIYSSSSASHKNTSAVVHRVSQCFAVLKFL